MQDSHTTQRLRFTFRGNGIVQGQRMAEATAERIDIHEAHADPNLADKQSWFGQEDTITSTLQQFDIPQRDIDGVLSVLHVNKVATLEVDLSADRLTAAGFAPST